MTKEEYIILKAAKEAEYAAMCQKVIDGINAEDFFQIQLSRLSFSLFRLKQRSKAIV